MAATVFYKNTVIAQSASITRRTATVAFAVATAACTVGGTSLGLRFTN